MAEGDHAKDIFFIRLREKVSREVLAGFAQEIHRAKTTGIQRTVIFVYLPQVDAYGAGRSFGSPWAMAEFDPGLKVEIHGLSAEQEAELVAGPTPPGGDVVGRWLYDALGGRIYTIYRKNGVLYLESKGSPKGGSSDEIVEVEHPTGRRFKRKEISRGGDYYLINRKGDLEIRDDEGLSSVCKKVE